MRFTSGLAFQHSPDCQMGLRRRFLAVSGLLLAASKIFRKKPCILPNLGESGLAGSLHLGRPAGEIVVS